MGLMDFILGTNANIGNAVTDMDCFLAEQKCPVTRMGTDFLKMQHTVIPAYDADNFKYFIQQYVARYGPISAFKQGSPTNATYWVFTQNSNYCLMVKV